MTRRHTTRRNHHRTAIKSNQPPCGICGKPINYQLKYPHPDAYVIDHITPLAAGGLDTLSNLQAAHNRCNREKSDHQYVNRIIKTSSTLA